MPFDAGFVAAIVQELNETILGARIEKIHQPERDEVILHLRSNKGNDKLLLSASPGSSRIGITKSEKENPNSPPMFCMLLRKHLSGGHILSITQLGFDRVLRFEISSRDEMGFISNKYIVAEIMGKYSNLIFLDEKMRVLSALHILDITSLNKRQLLPGFSYELPPAQTGKTDALSVTKELFLSVINEDLSQDKDVPADKFLISHFAGLSPLVAREIVYRTTKSTATRLSLCDKEALWFYFHSIYGEEKKFVPCLVCDMAGGPFEFSFTEIRQYENAAILKTPESFSALLDTYFAQRDAKDRIKQRAQDILKLLSVASSRINKKLDLQRGELATCSGKEKYKKWGDLITANMYLLKKGMEHAVVLDYTSEEMETVEIPLELNLTPSQNAQKYYKKYNKSKSAEVILKEQIEQGEKELVYLDSVFESLTKAENERDLAEIRSELSGSGYAKRLTALTKQNKPSLKQKANKAPPTMKPLTFTTSGGYRVLCGKNNLQNDYVTMSLANKNDYWFHVKGMPGSHTLLICGSEEPDAKDFTECAMIAAYYSSARKLPNAPVDYTRVKNIKKPKGAKPGFVLYETNFTAYVTADEELVLKRKTD